MYCFEDIDRIADMHVLAAADAGLQSSVQIPMPFVYYPSKFFVVPKKKN